MQTILKELKSAWTRGQFRTYNQLMEEINALDWRPIEEVPVNQLVDVKIRFPSFDGMLEKAVVGMLVPEVGWEISDCSIKEFTVIGWRELDI